MRLSEKQALALADSRFWESMSMRDRAVFQLHEDRLCMPFEVFQEAVEKTLGRPVFTHEFGLNRDGLIKELNGEFPAPTFREILDLIPPENRLVLIKD